MNIKRLQTDILILGSGGAGLFAALHAHQTAPDLSITVAVKGLLGKCGCTRMVQGGRPPSVLVRQPWLVIAPLVHTLLSQMIFGRTNREHLDSHRQGHIDLLTELLEPHWCSAAPPPSP